VTHEWHFNGPDLPALEAFPMAIVPRGGYKREDVTDEVGRLLEQFDRGFTTMMGELQTAWEHGDPDALDSSVSTMLTLREPAVALMQINIPSGGGTYGPCFRLI